MTDNIVELTRTNAAIAGGSRTSAAAAGMPAAIIRARRPAA
ncbi:MAG TPA: hypothetical protein VFC16_10640 [Nakamurella sp.]|nr:hypothetical protein [Nakamurella sp.]